MRVLIDTGAIYAFVVRNDQHHEAAKAFMRQWMDKKGLFVLADVVFSETVTLLKARLGPRIAVQVGHELRTNPCYRWCTLGIESERNTWAVFQRYEDKDWSYTDCALKILARRERIGRIFAFDHHFEQMTELERVPSMLD